MALPPSRAKLLGTDACRSAVECPAFCTGLGGRPPDLRHQFRWPQAPDALPPSLIGMRAMSRGVQGRHQPSPTSVSSPDSARSSWQWSRGCRHIHRLSRESGNPKAIGSKCVFDSYRILDSRFRGKDGNRRLETDILNLTTLPKAIMAVTSTDELRSDPNPVR